MPVSEPSSVNWPERCQIGAFDTGSLAGVYPLTSRSGRSDMTMREYVRADIHEAEVERLRGIVRDLALEIHAEYHTASFEDCERCQRELAALLNAS